MERAHIKIRGIVQGVGFRPFIHRLAARYKITGYIENTSSGVELEAEGSCQAIEDFVAAVPEEAPKLALIEDISAELGLAPAGYSHFEIRQSKTEQFRNTLISPDICVCEDCLREMNTPGDRRYRYPFINCTNCGPRFTIIRDVPYDRGKTSMAEFPMCPECDREYHDIADRRYHAQPDACPVCGPEVFFISSAGMQTNGDGAIEKARQYLKNGKIVAVKGLGGMHLACRSDMPELVKELRRRKQRDEKPFALMCRNLECVRKICFTTPEEEKVLAGFRRPIVLLEKKPGLPAEVSENGYAGVMLPYTPLHYLLFGNDIDALIMTSANLSDTPIMYKNKEALKNLAGVADGFLLNNRDIRTRCDDSLCHVLDGQEYFIRRSRGYVPFPVSTEKPLPMILGAGAEQKASFSLSKENYVFQSQHIGDLKNLETYENYTSQVQHFERLFDIAPEAAACDLHPDYMSTAFAEELAQEQGIRLIKTQHHHAHMAACMADNDLDGEVIGLIWDGTGFGTDGAAWGAECLAGGYKKFTRVCSIRQIPLIGGDIAVKDISRIGFAMAKAAGKSAPDGQREIMRRMLENSLNCPLSSGMGRLFDGFASLLGIKQRASYEGQGAVLLEAAAESDVQDALTYAMYEENGVLRLDWRPAVSQTIESIEKGENPGRLAAMFMNMLTDAAVKQCLAAKERTGLNRVVLSGGSFQNMYIMKRLPGKLEDEGFEVYHHRRVSCNDEGISLGQVMICASQCR